jgi:hypothetical protein
MLIDQLDDKNLLKLACMMADMSPQRGTDPMSMIKALMGSLPDHGGMIINSKPQVEEKVIDLPNGKMIIKNMRQARMGAMRDSFPTMFEDGVPSGDSMRSSMMMGGSPFGMGNKFPMSNPLEAMLSLLYAHGQESELGRDNMGMIESKAEETLGSEITKKITSFINNVKEGHATFVDEGKKVTVSVEEIGEAASTHRGVEADVFKPEDGIESEQVENLVKTSRYLGNASMTKTAGLLKRAGMVQTSLLKIANIMSDLTSKGIVDVNEHVRSLDNLLKFSMFNNGRLTTNSKTLQGDIYVKLAAALEDITSGGNEPNLIHDMVYNTNLPSNEEEIMHIEGYPIDIEKLKSLSYQEASKALTPQLTNMIFNEDHTVVDPDKFAKLIKSLSGDKENGMFERLAVPMLENFAPDEDVKETVGI